MSSVLERASERANLTYAAHMHSHTKRYWLWKEIVEMNDSPDKQTAKEEFWFHSPHSVPYRPVDLACLVLCPMGKLVHGHPSRPELCPSKLGHQFDQFLCQRKIFVLKIGKGEWGDRVLPAEQWIMTGGLAALIYWWILVDGGRINSSGLSPSSLPTPQGNSLSPARSEPINRMCFKLKSISSSNDFFRTARTFSVKSKNSCGSDGTPWSGQAKYCMCWIKRFSPVCRNKSKIVYVSSRLMMRAALTHLSHKTSSRNTKLPVSSASSLRHFTENELPMSNSSPSIGQYWWHFGRPRSITVVSITIKWLLSCWTMRQKSVVVVDNGPCVAMYRLTPPSGISMLT